ncbi:hypothetical protein XELAEV_18001894mg [Xenopus laevis]|uniref:Uncharacterized protein n=1 Tax=Xenopus laevis TaxID=8355 RepID=A0A974BQG5_XENLA|nr:hypothetical protein XELAEV_18001894mg [Xenopus laevis]
MDYLKNRWITFRAAGLPSEQLDYLQWIICRKRARCCVSTSNYILNMPWNSPISSVPLLVRACYSLLML